jgi:hypothetical protein
MRTVENFASINDPKKVGIFMMIGVARKSFIDQNRPTRADHGTELHPDTHCDDELLEPRCSLDPDATPIDSYHLMTLLSIVAYPDCSVDLGDRSVDSLTELR